MMAQAVLKRFNFHRILTSRFVFPLMVLTWTRSRSIYGRVATDETGEEDAGEEARARQCHAARSCPGKRRLDRHGVDRAQSFAARSEPFSGDASARRRDGAEVELFAGPYRAQPEEPPEPDDRRDDLRYLGSLLYAPAQGD